MHVEAVLALRLSFAEQRALLLLLYWAETIYSKTLTSAQMLTMQTTEESAM